MTEKPDILTTLNVYYDKVENYLETTFADQDGPLYNMMRHHLAIGLDTKYQGKKLRPILTLLCTEVIGTNWHNALAGAAAIEILHNFSLIHDDIQDESPTRRGIPTLWHKHGVAQSINAGDGMHAFSRLVLLRLEDAGYSAEMILACGQLMDETCLVLCEGQYADIDFQEKSVVPIDNYLDMIEKKTAKHFGTTLEIGALLGGAKTDIAKRYRNIGKNLGIAFQIRDDALDLWGGEVTGKQHAIDIQNKKKTLPIVYGLSQENPNGMRLRSYYEQPNLSQEDISQVIIVLEELGALEYCNEIADEYLELAINELDQIAEPSKALDKLRSLFKYLVLREY